MPADSDQINVLWADATRSLEEYIRIPCQSPAFDAEWNTNTLLDQVVDHVADWCRTNGPDALSLEVLRHPDRTPLIVMTIDGGGSGQVLIYGHVDKQPPMLPWDEGLEPYEPVIRDGRLYGRGAADDGYAAYATTIALAELAGRSNTFPRCTVIIEACEESGSGDLPAWLSDLDNQVGSPDLVVCLDSGCGNFDQLWMTTSLRGCVGGTLTIDVLDVGVHSGDAGGIVPDSFRIARRLLDRVEDSETGQVLLESARVDIPLERRHQAANAAAAIGSRVTGRFPLHGHTEPLATDEQAVLNRTWRSAIAVLGADGLPPTSSAGAVLRPSTSLSVSVRIPPTADGDAVVAELERRLTVAPPSGATASFRRGFCADGWAAPETAAWLAAAIESASRRHFGLPAQGMGEGGTIPFMALLGHRYPRAQFLVTGVLGPNSNAHGPNEFLHLDYTRRLIHCIADIIASVPS